MFEPRESLMKKLLTPRQVPAMSMPMSPRKYMSNLRTSRNYGLGGNTPKKQLVNVLSYKKLRSDSTENETTFSTQVKTPIQLPEITTPNVMKSADAFSLN